MRPVPVEEVPEPCPVESWLLSLPPDTTRAYERTAAGKGMVGSLMKDIDDDDI